jgi:subtilisin family serine protease
VSFPARYDQALAVGAATADDPDERAPFSSHGPEIDVVAVGEGIVGPAPNGFCPQFLPCVGGGHATGDGTSFAAPQVAGLAALVISRRPDMPARAIHDLVRASADPVPPGEHPSWAGAGRVNMLRALQPQYRLGAPGVSKN